MIVGWSACWHKWVDKHVGNGAWQVVVSWSASWEHEWVGQHVGNGVWQVGGANMLVMVPGKWLWAGQHVGRKSGMSVF